MGRCIRQVLGDDVDLLQSFYGIRAYFSGNKCIHHPESSTELWGPEFFGRSG